MPETHLLKNGDKGLKFRVSVTSRVPTRRAHNQAALFALHPAASRSVKHFPVHQLW